MTLPRPQAPTAHALRDAFRDVRAESLARAAPLSAEDQCIQSMPDASPTKWHLAHTTWFFETVLLQPHLSGYRAFDERFNYLFNSYYEALGPRHPRPQRGLLTRPTRDEVLAYRAHVDEGVERLLEAARPDDALWRAIEPIVSLGLQHEQQHQELLVTDILHAFSCNPLLPAYQPASAPTLRLATAAPSTRWLSHPGGQVSIGHAGPGFAFDNETPRHVALLQPHAIADRLVSCGDYARFIADGGYRNPPPDYPAESRRRGEEGVVRLLLRVGAEGQVEQAEVVASSGHPALDRAAVAAARRWRFRPASQAGLPVAATLATAVHFRLTDR
jgi:ergothioneine biosynthesis protein EgtB